MSKLQIAVDNQDSIGSDQKIPLHTKLLADCFIKVAANTFSKGYRPEARGYVIHSPLALPEGAARGQHTRGMNHITTS